MRRGFITVATGEYYHYLAINMLNSYKYSQTTVFPFAVITDPGGEAMLRDHFDEVIVIREVDAGFVNKLKIQELSPFDETIFIDSDTLIVRDISDWWEEFEKSGFDVTVWGWNVPIASPRVGKLISAKSIEKYHIDRYIGFNGGVYFFKNNDNARRIFQRAKALLDTYIEDEQYLFGGQKGDEPVMAVSLIEHGVYGMEDPEKKRMFCTPGMRKLKINLLRNKCTFIKYDYQVFPAVMHWGSSRTHQPTYRREVMILDLYNKKVPKFICYVVGWSVFVVKQSVFSTKRFLASLIRK